MSFPAYYRLAPGRYREQFGLYFQDFEVGQIFRHRPGITLTQQDNCDEALDTYNGAMIHFDDRYAAEASWKLPLMVSTLTVQRLLGMAGKTLGCRREVLGFKEISLTAPVFGGDTLYAESEVLDVEAGGDPAVGIVTLALRGFKKGPPGRDAAAKDGQFANLVCRVEVFRAAHWPAPVGPLAEPAREPRFGAYREEGGVLVEQYGLFFEDALPGDTFIHSPRRTFHRGDIVAHSRRALDHSPQYQDAVWVEGHLGGRYRVPEALLLGAVTALTTRTFGKVSANLGWTGIELGKVYEGDTIEAESTVVDSRISKSRQDEGVLTVDTLARNQHGEQVCAYRRNLLVYKKDASTPYAKAGY
jgi:itaconyl-CoA hydratase